MCLTTSGYAKMPWLSVIAGGAVGLVILPIIAVGQELGCEIGFPVAESTISGIILAGGQTMTIASVICI